MNFVTGISANNEPPQLPQQNMFSQLKELMRIFLENPTDANYQQLLNTLGPLLMNRNLSGQDREVLEKLSDIINEYHQIVQYLNVLEGEVKFLETELSNPNIPPEIRKELETELQMIKDLLNKQETKKQNMEQSMETESSFLN